MGANSRRRKERKNERAKDRGGRSETQPLFDKYGFLPLPLMSEPVRMAHEGFAHCLLTAFDSMGGERPVGLVAIVMRWYREYDTIMQRQPTQMAFVRDGATVKLQLACAPGCNHCCVTPVSVIGPEAVLISDYIKARFSEEQTLELVARIHAREQVVKGRQGMNYMCPLNVDGKCSIYEVRPFNCRKWHSFDEAACRQGFIDEDGTVEVPSSAVRADAMGVFWQTASAVLGTLGFETDDVDFIPALMIALVTQEPVRRLASGEPLFTAVRWTASGRPGQVGPR